jgi:hypothetical protein
LTVEFRQKASKKIKNLEGNEKQKKFLKRLTRAASVDAKSYDELIDALRERITKRSGWNSRVQDELFKKMPEDCRPESIPFPPAFCWYISSESFEIEVLETSKLTSRSVLDKDPFSEYWRNISENTIELLEDLKTKFAALTLKYPFLEKSSKTAREIEDFDEPSIDENETGDEFEEIDIGNEEELSIKKKSKKPNPKAELRKKRKLNYFETLEL